VVPTLQEADAAGNCSDMEVDQQLLGETEGGHNFTHDPVPDIPVVNILLPNVLPTEVWAAGSVGVK